MRNICPFLFVSIIKPCRLYLKKSSNIVKCPGFHKIFFNVSGCKQPFDKGAKEWKDFIFVYTLLEQLRKKQEGNLSSISLEIFLG